MSMHSTFSRKIDVQRVTLFYCCDASDAAVTSRSMYIHGKTFNNPRPHEVASIGTWYYGIEWASPSQWRIGHNLDTALAVRTNDWTMCTWY